MGNSKSSTRPRIEFGQSFLQGKRETMEDTLVAKTSDTELDTGVFAVFDGHNGPECSAFLQDHFIDALQRQQPITGGEMGQVESAMKKAAEEVDAAFLKAAKKNRWQSGSTGLLVYWKGNDIWISNTGDSRAMAVVDGKAHPLSVDQKPETPGEKDRIEASGAKITDGRIQGQLAMSRAFGNPALKAQGFLSAEPEVTHFTLDDNVQYVVLATDGLWDVMSCRRVASLIAIHQRYHKAPGLADELVLEAMRRNSMDNIAVIVLKVNRKSKCAAGQP